MAIGKKRIPEDLTLEEARRNARELMTDTSITDLNSSVYLSQPQNSNILQYVQFVIVGNDTAVPNASNIQELKSDIAPDKGETRMCGTGEKPWKNTVSQSFTIRDNFQKKQLKFDYEGFLGSIGFKGGGNKVMCPGYGAHRFYGVDNAVTIKINRPVPFDVKKLYTRFDKWMFEGMYSPTDVNVTTGQGIMRMCENSASCNNPGCEFEIVDRGNVNCVYARFRNFHPFAIVCIIRVVF